jgi:hypothetical protein
MEVVPKTFMARRNNKSAYATSIKLSIDNLGPAVCLCPDRRCHCTFERLGPHEALK